ncbi:protein ABIL2-like isoform X2 [Cynara cardunculus var. scolymus]|uniref:protein ABIL2-like isoform X2 n=1 Tax=Cynara cardunculus var. scolymus TaxID=59895 RepID=UPI000D62AE44|nr:protein ABIL2-like isoform X2 [Cynara cardunculus var. scolymus]
MEAKDTSSSSPSNLHPPSNYDEIFMQRSLLFADSLKDLRTIRTQLYSAAEFFEDSYHGNDHDQLLFESLKDYVSKALISTIDHLGSVTSKVDSFLNENVDEVFETNLGVLCMEQRLRTCQTYSDHEGLSQQSLVIQIPKYHKQYHLPDGRFSGAVKAEKAKAETLGLSASIGVSRAHNMRFLHRRGHTQQASVSDFVAFSFTKPALTKGSEKRSRSISPSRFRIKRSGSGSAANQFSTPSFPAMRSGSSIHQSISPSSRQQNPAEGWRSHSLYPEREKRKDIEVYSKKTRNLFKALLSMHKYKNESGPPYR